MLHICYDPLSFIGMQCGWSEFSLNPVSRRLEGCSLNDHIKQNNCAKASEELLMKRLVCLPSDSIMYIMIRHLLLFSWCDVERI